MRTVLVIPPFGGLDRPALGPHVLQACAHRRGHPVSVFYANLRFAALVGENLYHRVCYGPTTGLAGERIFAAAAYGVPPLGQLNPSDEAYFKRISGEKQSGVTLAELRALEATTDGWLDEIVAEILTLEPDIVGCSTTFEQTAASLAILRRLQVARPGLVTLLGGSNCDGEMAHGLTSVAPDVDYIFSGECEVVFPDFLDQLATGERPPCGVVEGKPCWNLDDLPNNDYSEFYAQVDAVLGETDLVRGDHLWVPYESSRGCWWGEKSHCTFCGINGQTMNFRAKSPDKVIDELRELLEAHPNGKVCMVDNIMPHTYFKTLIPRLPEELPGLHAFYEQKANLKLKQVLSLRRAGVVLIQPGIEALSTGLLRLMKKGVRASQNVALLRYSRVADLGVNWNLLYAFPHDEESFYRETVELLPLLSHLHPPSGVFHLSLDRFSPYFKQPEAFDIEDMHPLQAYLDVLPEGADVERIAYHFVGEYPTASGSRSEVLEEIRAGVATWRSAWQNDGPPPVLSLSRLGEESFMLVDTRPGVAQQQFTFLGYEQARVALIGATEEESAALDWARKQRVVTPLDGKWVPLAVADAELLVEFEGGRRPSTAAMAREDAA